MCLIAFAWNAHPRFPLILVANRDEFHERPTAALAAWDDVPGAYGGRDLVGGGGWLAMHRAGRLAAVTNVREPRIPPAPRSRGELVRGFLSGDERAATYAGARCAEAAAFAPFNLLLWDGRDLVYASNRPQPNWRALEDGVYGLSNGALNSRWPKVTRLTGALHHWLQAGGDAQSLQPLFTALADETLAADAGLPCTGVPLATERRLSPPFIRGSGYGTRASTLVLVDRTGAAQFIERSFGADGIALGERQMRLHPTDA